LDALKKPLSPAERDRVAKLWQEILAIPTVDPDRTFADQGGTSLGANQLVARIANQLGRDVPVIRVFEHPTLRQFLRFLGAASPEAKLSGPVESATPRGPSLSPGNAARDVAIVGIACRFPGASSVDEYWRNLLDGRESIRALSEQELPPTVSAETRNDPRYVRAAGLIDRPYAMDAAFFDINPMEARLTDPQHRVLLETSWDALDHAGHGAGTFRGKAAVFAGTEDNSYYKSEIVPFPEAEARAGRFSVMTGNEKDFVAMRIAHKLDLRGPAISVNTACSTSLVAVIMACKSLRERECDLALAGGSTVHFPTPEGYFFQEGGVFSSDGHCRPFDQAAEGTVFTDGVGVVVLKRLDDAVRDRDTIYAVIKGGAINNDGAAKISFSAPSVSGQATCIAAALADAAVDPATIGYVEAHGTATPVGDPIELEGLRQAFGPQPGKGQFCGLGSVKSNIGHTTTAAGVAGLIKAALALKHGVIPATLHYRAPNPRLELERSPFFIVDRRLDWPRGATPRRAGVSSFGIGGTNSHVVLEEPPVAQAVETAAPEASRPFEILPVSGRTAAARDLLLQRLDAERHPLRDLATTLQHGRSRFKHRGAALRLPRWSSADALITGAAAALDEPRAVFLFPGQGSQYIGMGRSLSAELPEFRRHYAACCELLSAELGLDFEAFIFDPANQETLENTRYTQPALFALEVSLGRTLLDWGLVPSLMIGHSIGEFAAAHLAGVFSLEDGIRLIAARGRLMADLPRGKMLSARAAIDKVLAAAGEEVDVASINSPVHSVLAGADEQIARVQARLEAAGIPCRLLHTSHAFHSAMMDPVVEPFLELVRTVRLSAPSIPIISTVTGEPMRDADALDPAYWARHLRATVKFSPALTRAIRDGANLFVEIGPRTTLASLATQHLVKDAKASASAAIATLGDSPEPEIELAALGTALARLWTSGLELPWDRIWSPGSRVPLASSYPFDRKEFRFSEGRQQQARPQSSVPAPLSASVTVAVAAPIAASPAAAGELAADLATLFGDFAGMPIDRACATFIESGFDSLVLMQIGLELGKRYGVAVSLGDLMKKHNTLARLAAHLAASAQPARLPQVATVLAAPVQAQVAAPTAPLSPAAFDPAPALADDLAALFGDFAGMPIERAEATFIESGFDSLVLMQIGLELGKRYGVAVSLGDLMKKHNSLARLAAHLAAVAPADRLPRSAVAFVTPPAPTLLPSAAPFVPPVSAALPSPSPVAQMAVSPVVGTPGTVDVAQIIDAQLRQMREIFEMQLRYATAARTATPPVSAVVPAAPIAAAIPARAPASRPQPPLSTEPAAKAAPEPANEPAPRRRTERSGAPLTVMQERIRFMEEMHPGRVVYSIPSAHHLTGPLDLGRFESALREVIRRQPALRTCIARTTDGRWTQHVEAPGDGTIELALPYEDLSGVAADERSDELAHRMQGLIDQPFDIHTAPLFRAALWKLDAHEHAFLFVPHHLIWDGWSFDLLYDELATVYGALARGASPALAPLEFDYGDFAQWHLEWQRSDAFAQQLNHWKTLFARQPAPQSIVTDRPRGNGRSGTGGVEWIRFDANQAERLRTIARASGSTLSMLIAAAYAAWVAQLIGSDRVVLGVPVRGRRLPAFEPVMGFFNNLLPLPLAVDRRQPFGGWVATVGEVLADAFDNQDVPFERLATEPELAAWARQAGVPYHALVSYQDARRRNSDWGGLVHQAMPVNQYTATEDFGLWVTERSDGLECRLVYNADVFSAATAALGRSRLEALFERILERPTRPVAELIALGDAERATVSTWSIVYGGARVVSADGEPVPIGVAGALVREGRATGQQARWTAEGTLQILEAPAAAASPARAGASAAASAASLSPTEQALSAIWSEVLNLTEVRASDNFFELGGTSLQAMQAATLVGQRLGQTIHARRFVMESLRSLARGIDAAPTDHALPEPTGEPPRPTAPAPAAIDGPRRGLVERLAGVFRRPRPTARAASLRLVPPARIEPAPPAEESPAPPAKLVTPTATETALEPGHLRRVSHRQPPLAGAFRATTSDGVEAWFRRSDATGGYERIER
jgi:acyl transferase domain-containing protein/acyl carrier protein